MKEEALLTASYLTNYLFTFVACVSKRTHVNLKLQAFRFETFEQFPGKKILPNYKMSGLGLPTWKYQFSCHHSSRAILI